jgi:hypothetical protein
MTGSCRVTGQNEVALTIILGTAIKLGRPDRTWHLIEKKSQPQMNKMDADQDDEISPPGVAGRQTPRF